MPNQRTTTVDRILDWPEDGAILVRKSAHPTHPYYLQRAINDWEANRYFGVRALVGEEFATREEAEARAAELREERS